MSERIDYEGLPDDPELAFVRLVDFFDQKLKEAVRGSDDDDTRLHLIEHMNSILGAATALHIHALGSFRLPDWESTYNVHRDFDLAVKSVVLQIQIQKARVTKLYSVNLNTADKERIHHLVRQIRETLEAADLDSRKKNSLFAKLNAFEADVDRARTRFENAMLAFVDLAHVVHKGTETLKPITDLVKRINELLGAAKSDEPEPPKIPSPEDIKRVEPPKRQIEDFSRRGGGLDDEIPF
ncbi:hypothetical protein FJW07_30630 [Mesorhizobium sp. B3-1-9]|uniref:hypothetical protein n=1 Tax=unclassified Mesorhizobium TaxID=325217 RepID=UPI00112EA3B2|nr:MULTISPECIES: hypothetical protein [unclassified Mesorhizobium]TPI28783.1 hypothetical protein FJW07_30630 [Mesorhizobium sp. B3-1-9]TPI65036.1 hypothetical protein FJ417_00165 [Mesorhizobium sp. B3-1-7]